MMRIWYGTILIVIVVLTGYLVSIVNRYLPALEATINGQQSSIKALQTTIDQQNKLLAALQTDLKKLNADNNPPPKPAQEDKGKMAVDSLRNCLTIMSEADAKNKQGNVNSAIDLLKSVKQTLWQAGDVLPTHQAALRPLMGPIDAIIGKWKQGDKSVDTSKIALAIRAVLKKIDSKFDT